MEGFPHLEVVCLGCVHYFNRKNDKGVPYNYCDKNLIPDNYNRKCKYKKSLYDNKKSK